MHGLSGELVSPRLPVSPPPRLLPILPLFRGEATEITCLRGRPAGYAYLRAHTLADGHRQVPPAIYDSALEEPLTHSLMLRTQRGRITRDKSPCDQ